jgi:hypothetical protein
LAQVRDAGNGHPDAEGLELILSAQPDVYIASIFPQPADVTNLQLPGGIKPR